MDSELGLSVFDWELEEDLNEEMYGFLDELETEQLQEMNRRICSMLKDRSIADEREAAEDFKVGDRIQFYSKKHSRTVEGTIEKKNPRTVALSNCSDGVLWRVPYRHLKMA